MGNNKITYKRFYNRKFLLNEKSNNNLDELIKDKKHYWSTTGRNGLRILFDLLNFKKGDEILVPAFVAHGIILPIKKKGLIPVYYKSDKNLVPDINDVIEKIRDKKVVAFFFIHYFGFPQDINAILEITKKKKIITIEDCAQALFSTYPSGELVGSKGDIALYSLTKFLPIPDGSLFVINNPNLNIDISKIVYKFSLISSMSVLLARIQLLINTKLFYGVSSFYDHFLNIITKLITPLHYFLICIEWKNVNISDGSTEYLKKIDIDKIMETRKNNSYYIIKNLNMKTSTFYRNFEKQFCTTGIPILSENREVVINSLKKNRIKSLVYNKFWWFIPVDKIDNFKNEYKIYKNHFLLPSNENLDKEELNLIINSLNNLH